MMTLFRKNNFQIGGIYLVPRAQIISNILHIVYVMPLNLNYIEDPISFHIFSHLCPSLLRWQVGRQRGSFKGTARKITANTMPNKSFLTTVKKQQKYYSNPTILRDFFLPLACWEMILFLFGHLKLQSCNGRFLCHSCFHVSFKQSNISNMLHCVRFDQQIRGLTVNRSGRHRHYKQFPAYHVILPVSCSSLPF